MRKAALWWMIYKYRVLGLNEKVRHPVDKRKEDVLKSVCLK